MKSALLLCVFALTGCADTQTLVLDSTPRKPSTHVEIFETAVYGTNFPSAVNEAFAQHHLAALSWKGPTSDELKAKQHFVEECQRLGANGLIFTIVPIGMHYARGVTVFEPRSYVDECLFRGEAFLLSPDAAR